MSRQYDKLGLRFLYPENWTIADEAAGDGPRSVTLQTPDGGYWIVQLHETADPHELTRHALKAMREEYEQLEAESVIESLAGLDVVGFDLRFYCLDLLIGSAIRGALWDRRRQSTLLVLYQAEDREFERLRPVFDGMLLNLLSNVKASSTLAP